MKALNCPSCSAPIGLKKGIKKYKCSFCENNFYPDYENAPEFNGLNEKEFKKLKKRADDAFARGLMEKAKTQYSSLLELLKEDYERFNDYIQIKARYHKLRIHRYIIQNYDVPYGDTIVDIQNRASGAFVNNPSDFYYARIDEPVLNIIEDIEDECELIKELEKGKTLEEGTAQAFGVFCYSEINILLSKVIPKACEFIYLNCSFNKELGYWNWIDNEALAEPVYIGLRIHAEYLGIMMKFLENINIGDDYSDKSLIAMPLYLEAEELIAGVNLQKINKRDLYSDYTLNAIRDIPSVREFFSSFEKLNLKLKPALEKVRIEAKEKEIIKLEKAERERKEYELSSKYAKEKRDETFSYLAIIFVIGAAMVVVFNTEKRKFEDSNNRALNIKEREIIFKNKDRPRRLEELQIAKDLLMDYLITIRLLY